MKRSAKSKALAIAHIKANDKVKPHHWGARSRGPWDKRARKAEGGAVTDPDILAQLNAEGPKLVADPAILAQLNGDEAPDHGLSERQKLSPVGKALSPITSYPETYQRMNKEAREQISGGVVQMLHPKESLVDPEAHGLSEVLTGAGKAALGTVGYVASPISAAYRSVMGQPVEDVTGIPREYTEFAGQLATPGLGMTKLPKAPAVLPKPAAAPNEVVAAAGRVSEAAGSPVDVPRAFASDNIAVQRAGQMARNVPIVGDSIPRATGQMADQLADATKSIASTYGEGSGPNVASRVGRTIQSSADAEAAAAAQAARQSDDAVLAAWQRDTDAAHQSIAAREAQSLEQARNAVGDLSPQDMGEALIGRLRAGEQEARARRRPSSGQRAYACIVSHDGRN